MSPDSEAIGVLAERVRRLEEDQQESRRALQSFSNRMDQNIAELRTHITNSVASLKYVDLGLYERDRKELETSVAEAKADAERGIKVAWGIAVAFAVPFIGGLASIIMKAAG